MNQDSLQIITCAECGWAPVSSSALTCPRCGKNPSAHTCSRCGHVSGRSSMHGDLCFPCYEKEVEGMCSCCGERMIPRHSMFEAAGFKEDQTCRNCGQPVHVFRCNVCGFLRFGQPHATSSYTHYGQLRRSGEASYRRDKFTSYAKCCSKCYPEFSAWIQRRDEVDPDAKSGCLSVLLLYSVIGVVGILISC